MHGVDTGTFVGEQNIANAQNECSGHCLLHNVCLDMRIPDCYRQWFIINPATRLFP
jgi:hypothetical protein